MGAAFQMLALKWWMNFGEWPSYCPKGLKDHHFIIIIFKLKLNEEFFFLWLGFEGPFQKLSFLRVILPSIFWKKQEKVHLLFHLDVVFGGMDTLSKTTKNKKGYYELQVFSSHPI